MVISKLQAFEIFRHSQTMWIFNRGVKINQSDVMSNDFASAFQFFLILPGRRLNIYIPFRPHGVLLKKLT
jgi:hypothetical protein